MYELSDDGTTNIYNVSFDYNSDAEIDEGNFAEWQKGPRFFGLVIYWVNKTFS